MLFGGVYMAAQCGPFWPVCRENLVFLGGQCTYGGPLRSIVACLQGRYRCSLVLCIHGIYG